MNRYTHTFFAECPNNGLMIAYTLIIETNKRMIPVEDITHTTRKIKSAYHEAIADELHHRFGGRQVLKAHHHGVDIETVREDA